MEERNERNYCMTAYSFHGLPNLYSMLLAFIQRQCFRGLTLTWDSPSHGYQCIPYRGLWTQWAEFGQRIGPTGLSTPQHSCKGKERGGGGGGWRWMEEEEEEGEEEEEEEEEGEEGEEEEEEEGEEGEEEEEEDREDREGGCMAPRTSSYNNPPLPPYLMSPM